MEKAIEEKKVEISEFIKKYKEIVHLNINKIPAYFQDKSYFKYMEDDLNDMDDFEELKKIHFDLGYEFREFDRSYDIKHSFISEKTINIFLRQKPFGSILSQKPGEKLIHTDDAPEMNNKKEIEAIENIRLTI